VERDRTRNRQDSAIRRLGRHFAFRGRRSRSSSGRVARDTVARSSGRHRRENGSRSRPPRSRRPALDDRRCRRSGSRFSVIARNPVQSARDSKTLEQRRVLGAQDERALVELEGRVGRFLVGAAGRRGRCCGFRGRGTYRTKPNGSRPPRVYEPSRSDASQASKRASKPRGVVTSMPSRVSSSSPS